GRRLGAPGGVSPQRSAGTVLAGLEGGGVAEALADVRRRPHRPWDQDDVAPTRPNSALAVDDAADAGVLLAGGVVVMHVDEALKPVERRVVAKGRLDAMHHLAAVQLGPAQRARHR